MMPQVGPLHVAEEAERRGDFGRARVIYEEMLLDTGDLAQGLERAEIVRRVGRTLHMQGDFGAALDCFRAAEAAADAGGLRDVVAAALNSQAATAQTMGELEDAEALYHRASATAREAGAVVTLAMVEQNLGTVASIRGDFGGALQHYQAALATYEQLDLQDRVGPLLSNIGRLSTDLELWDEGVAALDRAFEAVSRTGDDANALLVLINRTRLETARGQFAEAHGFSRASQALAQRIGDRRWAGQIAQQEGVILREKGDGEGAGAQLFSAFAIAEAQGDHLLQAESARELGLVHWNANRNQETLRWLLRAHRLFQAVQARREVADIGSRLEHLEDIFLQVVLQWGSSIESKDPYTQGHSQRVASFGVDLAIAVGMERELLPWFRMGGLLHDVGKVVVPLKVLNKPGTLDPEEWAIMKTHPAEGVRLLGDIDFPWDIRPMVRHHHEHWDGSGYPDGLKRTQIPLAARILCVADVFDALTSDRPYREGFPEAKALSIMEQMAGETLDPELFAIFRELRSGTMRIADSSGNLTLQVLT